MDLAAEGGELVSTFPVFPKKGSNGSEVRTFAGWATWSGTSFATAIVTGQLAHVMTDGKERVDAFTAAELLRQRATAWTSDDLHVPVVQRRKWALEPAARGQLASAAR